MTVRLKLTDLSTDVLICCTKFHPQLAINVEATLHETRRHLINFSGRLFYLIVLKMEVSVENTGQILHIPVSNVWLSLH